jgi:hypothetical protein
MNTFLVWALSVSALFNFYLVIFVIPDYRRGAKFWRDRAELNNVRAGLFQQRLSECLDQLRELRNKSK